MSYDAERLLSLLPALYRERDANEGGRSLERLLAVVAREADLLERDVETLLDDLFIETCRDWVVPYIGDLVGNDLLFESTRTDDGRTAEELFDDLAGPDLRPPVAARARADVAKTISYRRRKGTPAMLEELARDVTGQSAHVEEMFEHVGWTQDLEHRRPGCGFANLRSPERMDRIGGAFDDTTHTADVRPPGGHPRHNVPNVSFFLWRLRSYPLQRVPARRGSAAWQRRFSPLGHDAPLFSARRREAAETERASELDVAGRIRHLRFCQDLLDQRAGAPPRPGHSELYGEPGLGAGVSFAVYLDGALAPLCADPAAPLDRYEPRVIARPLDPWPAQRPPGATVSIDVESGRIALGRDLATNVTVSTWHHYGFGADLGGGPYDRRRWLIRRDADVARLLVRTGASDDPAAGLYGTLAAALAAWEAGGRANTVVSIDDSQLHDLPPKLELPASGALAIEATDGRRPVLIAAGGGPLEVAVAAPGGTRDPERSAALTLSGVVVEGALHVTGDLGRLRLLHATLVPGRRFGDDGIAGGGPSVEVDAGTAGKPLNDRLRVEVAFSISGPLVLPAHARDGGVWLLDSILDGLGGHALAGPESGGEPGFAPGLVAERTTVAGAVRCARLEASDSIFTAPIEVERTQEGCARFSYVAPGSRTPRRYRCQPDHAIAAALREAVDRDPETPEDEREELRDFVRSRVAPMFSARSYGDPGYGQLHLACAPEIATGSDDGAEMGAFNHVKQPQRESNLRVRLDEYLPFGREAGVIYES